MCVGDFMKKIALITGISKGLGAVIACKLAKQGYDIIGTYNTDITGALNLKEKLELEQVKLDLYKLDLSSTINMNEFINTIKEKYNHIDLLINNAALSLDNNFVDKTKDEFMKVLEVNLVGPFLLIQGLFSILDNGIVINISSTDGIDTYSSINIDYSASKAGLINLTKSLSITLNNIKIYTICPNWMNTETIMNMNQEYLKEEMNRIGQNELIDPNIIASKIIELTNSNLESGTIIVVGDNNE